MRRDLVLGLDIGGTNIRVGLVDRALHVHGFVHVESNAIEGLEGPRHLGAFIAAYLNNHLGGDAPLAVAIGFPSALDKSRHKLLSTPNLSGFDNVNIVDILEEMIPTKVLVDRDVNLLFRYDCYAHHLPRQGFVVGCYMGTGTGNVIAYNGEILTGKNGVAAEMGHIPMHGGTGLCGCGNRGCAETMASGKRLFEIQAEFFPDTSIGDLFTQHGEEGILKDFIDDLTIPIATEINLLDPEYVILGGGLLQMADFPTPSFEERLMAHVRKPFPAQNLQIIYVSGTLESGVIGAALLAFEKEEHVNG